ncbi:MAG: LacI family DNA-binding transcriptional regulator [Planctomycetota bacterium]
MRPRNPTLLDVARRAEVSRATASAVLGGRADAMKISSPTRVRVLAAAKALRYRPNLHARRLRARRSRVIGVLVAHLGDVWYGMLTNELDVALARARNSMLLATAENRPGRCHACLDLLTENAVDGVVFVGGALPVRRLLRDLSPLPSLWIPGNPRLRGTLSVGMDPDHAASLLVDHLAALGHTRFAYVGFSPRQVDSSLRLRSLRTALASFSLSLDPDCVALAPRVAGIASTQSGYRAAHDLLARRPDVTALVAFDDNTALGAIGAARDLGRSVGCDLSIVGLDDNPYAALANPPLTTVRYPVRAVARAAASSILRLIDPAIPPQPGSSDCGTAGPPPPNPLWIPGELVIRSSTGPCPPS